MGLPFNVKLDSNTLGVLESLVKQYTSATDNVVTAVTDTKDFLVEQAAVIRDISLLSVFLINSFNILCTGQHSNIAPFLATASALTLAYYNTGALAEVIGIIYDMFSAPKAQSCGPFSLDMIKKIFMKLIYGFVAKSVWNKSGGIFSFFESYFHEIGMKSRIFDSAASIGTSLVKTISDIVNWIVKKITGRVAFTIGNSLEPKLDSLVKDINSLEERLISNQALPNFLTYTEFKNLEARIDSLDKELPDSIYYHQLKGVLQSQKAKIRSIRNSFTVFSVSGEFTKMETIAPTLLGGPGTGKTTIVNMLMEDVYKYTATDEERERFDNKFALAIWPFSKDQDHHNGYAKQWGVFMDDFNNRVDSPQNPNPELTFLIALVNSAKFTANMASLPDKGMEIDSPWCFITSNIPNFSFASLTDAQAVRRRLEPCIMMRVKPEYIKEDSQSPDLGPYYKKIDTNKLEKDAFGNVNKVTYAHLFDLVDATKDPKSDTGREILKTLTYDELVQYLIERDVERKIQYFKTRERTLKLASMPTPNGKDCVFVCDSDIPYILDTLAGVPKGVHFQEYTDILSLREKFPSFDSKKSFELKVATFAAQCRRQIRRFMKARSKEYVLHLVDSRAFSYTVLKRNLYATFLQWLQKFTPLTSSEHDIIIPNNEGFSLDITEIVHLRKFAHLCPKAMIYYNVRASCFIDVSPFFDANAEKLSSDGLIPLIWEDDKRDTLAVDVEVSETTSVYLEEDECAFPRTQGGFYDSIRKIADYIGPYSNELPTDTQVKSVKRVVRDFIYPYDEFSHKLFFNQVSGPQNISNLFKVINHTSFTIFELVMYLHAQCPDNMGAAASELKRLASDDLDEKALFSRLSPVLWNLAVNIQETYYSTRKFVKGALLVSGLLGILISGTSLAISQFVQEEYPCLSRFLDIFGKTTAILTIVVGTVFLFYQFSNKDTPLEQPFVQGPQIPTTDPIASSDKVLEDINRVVSAQTYEMLGADGSRIGYALFYAGTRVLTNKHLVDNILAAGKDSPDGYLTFRNVNVKMAQFEVPVSAFSDRVCHDEEDICLVEIPRNLVAPRKNIIKYFSTTKDYPKNFSARWVVPTGDHIQVVNRDVVPFYAEILRNSEVRRMAGPDKKWKFFDGSRYYTACSGFFYNNVQEFGDCGAPLLSCLTSMRSERIIGIHAASSGTVHGSFAISVDQDCVSLLDSKFEAHRVDMTDDYPYCQFRKGDMFIRLSKYPNKSSPVSFSNQRTTPFLDSFGPSNLVPSDMSRPIDQLVNRYAKPKKYIKQELLDRVARNVVLRTFGNDKNRLLKGKSFGEAVWGGTECFKNLDLSTSPGAPYIWMFKNKRGKKGILGDPESFSPSFRERCIEFYDYIYENEPTKDEFIQHFKYNEDDTLGCDFQFYDNLLVVVHDIKTWLNKLKDNMYDPPIYIDYPKDEVLKAGKDTRVFSCSPLWFTILTRMKFGGFAEEAIKRRIENGTAIGVNPFSEEWDRVGKRLRRFSNIADTDFKEFDTSAIGQLIVSIAEAIRYVYCHGWSEEDFKPYYYIFVAIAYSVHVTSDYSLIMWCGAMPSGNPLTTLINCMTQLVLFLYAWVEIHGTTASIPAFYENVYLITLGDDGTRSVSENSAGTYTCAAITECMSRIGYKMTSATKDSVGKYGSLEDAQFLKRSFVFNRVVGRYVGPLKFSSMLKMLYFTKKTQDWKGIVASNVNNFLLEASYHGEEFFREKFETILSICSDIGFEIPSVVDYKDAVLLNSGREPDYTKFF
jgi:hypothetical protein